MLIPLLFLACTGHPDDTGELAEAPSLSWLTPADGDTVAAGEVACSVVVDDFTLEDPAKHNEGAPIGYISVSVDGAEVLTTGSTNFTLTLTAGAHDLSAALFYADGDEIEPPVAATVAVSVE